MLVLLNIARSRLALFYDENRELFDSVRKERNICGLLYPPIKFLDMAIWQIGWDKKEEIKRLQRENKDKRKNHLSFKRQKSIIGNRNCCDGRKKK